jgi:thiol-disulfide isomerase/thioredoxin
MNNKMFWLAFLFPLFTIGQEKALKVGDTLPFALLAHATNGQPPDLNIQNLAEGSTILDFWATWCTSCANGIRKLTEYKSRYPNLQVLLINSVSTGDSYRKINSFMTKQSQIWGGACPFQSVIEDTLFAKLFPHRLLPHYIWLRKGKIVAITGGEAITESYIKHFLAGRELINSKIDIDPDQPLFINYAIPLPEMKAYAILMKGYYPGLGSGNQLRRSGNKVIGHAIKNMSLIYIYEVIAKQLIPYFNEKRLVIKEEDSKNHKYLFNSNHDKNELYNLDYIVPRQYADSLYPLMLQFVNSATNWNGSIRSKKKTVWQLKSTNGTIKQANYGEKHINQDFILIKSISGLVSYLNNRSWLEFPIVPDDSNKFPLVIKMPKNLSSISELQTILNKQGLTLQKTYQTIKVLLIEPKHN